MQVFNFAIVLAITFFILATVFGISRWRRFDKGGEVDTRRAKGLVGRDQPVVRSIRQ